MKIGTTILLIFIAVVVVGGIVYFALPQDKCKDVNCNDNNLCTTDSCNSETGNCVYTPKTCPSGKQCNSQTGVCESPANVLDDIENAIDEELETCTPKTCSQLNKECESWNNGCGDLIDCGSCSSGEECENGLCIEIEEETSTDGMDRIENAIEQALG